MVPFPGPISDKPGHISDKSGHSDFKMFFDHADEERQHGIKFLEYLRMRGENSTRGNFSSRGNSRNFSLFSPGDTQDSGIVGDEVLKPILKKYEWTNMEEALR